ncbi:putative PD-(D/E)XK family protein DUF4420 [Rhodobacter viridis]|uniref:Putative PD-(D/E)XK family protein DUF4420 n=1 Tax=Rhodobacter viridis TaxID=1054202 RepID=A0A318U0Q3_9RHOB|nr:PD-(D/E)XK motif protein [Rhodobacter viridis]PYF10384.1 putative PD-(D/E)XK family protein DUF4420 [Rhodobacter viridis]
MTGWTEDGLLKSWRALAKRDGESDWQFVHLTDVGPVAIKAGCHFPGGREALLVSFPGTVLADGGGLPEGKGFDVMPIKDTTQFAGRSAIGLVRRVEGSLDIFAVMAADVLRALDATSAKTPQALAKSLVGRVSEWQAFMARKRRPMSPQSQIGLAGELCFLDRLCDLLGASEAVELWKGPLHAAQDFHIGTGAVEVKSSMAGTAFLARINSLEQLDTELAPLHLAAVRFEEADDGLALPERVAALRARMSEAGVRRALDALLLLSGYDDEHADHYRRRLRIAETRSFAVGPDFPCLRRATTPGPIRKVVYTLDLDALGQPAQPLEEALFSLGMIHHEP